MKNIKAAKKPSSENPVQLVLNILNDMEIVHGDASLVAVVKYANGVRKRLAFSDTRLRNLITATHFSRYGTTPKDANITDAMRIISAKYDAEPVEDLAYRVNYINNVVLIDRYDDKLSYIEIDKNGWRKRNGGYDYFIANSAQRELVDPIRCNDGLDILDNI